MAKKAAKKKAVLGIARSVVVEQNCNGCWFWKIRAGNGEILAHSEGYASSQACMETAAAIAKQLNVKVELRTLSD